MKWGKGRTKLHPFIYEQVWQIVVAFQLCLGSLAHDGAIILYSWTSSSSFLLSSSSKTSLENASGFALMQFCKATKGCTHSEPYKTKKIKLFSNNIWSVPTSVRACKQIMQEKVVIYGARNALQILYLLFSSALKETDKCLRKLCSTRATSQFSYTWTFQGFLCPLIQRLQKEIV